MGIPISMPQSGGGGIVYFVAANPGGINLGCYTASPATGAGVLSCSMSLGIISFSIATYFFGEDAAM